MRRYIIIAIAIMAAILVMSLVKMIQARRAKARGEIPHKTAGIDISHIIGALVGLAVFFVGAVLLESGASAPWTCLLYTSPRPRDKRQSRMPSSA